MAYLPDTGVFSIGYNNALEYSTLTASSEATGYPVSNVLDRLRVTFWRGAVQAGSEAQWVTADLGAFKTQRPNYLVVGDVDPSVAPYQLSIGYSSDGVTWTDRALTGPPPLARGVRWYREDDMYEQPSTVTAKRYWRVGYPAGLLSAGNQVRMSVLMLGRRLDFPEGIGVGFAPVHYKPKERFNVSRGGAHVGAVIESIESDLIVSGKWSGAGIDSLWAANGPTGGGSYGPGEGGLLPGTNSPTLARYLASYYSRRRPVALRFSGDAEWVWWGRPAGEFKDPYLTPTRKSIELRFQVDADSVLLSDVNE